MAKITEEQIMVQATARHLLVKTEEECASLKQQIIDGADFAELARKHSACPSGAQGGELGSFGPGMMVREFDEVVFSAPLNEVQGPVKTAFGFHLLEVTSRD
ncbi:MAG: peptidylprolyl isomerase [Shewanella algae]|nr:peptidyl-prolyl cis-trans isomerase [Shewanella algae]BCV41337.1 peptidyl-prolyl cis-trans isomerase [Shewanella algae]BCV49998.1 peptidyl-prolyl cis-trans isomerase [Shewanella algae]